MKPSAFHESVNIPEQAEELRRNIVQIAFTNPLIGFNLVQEDLVVKSVK
jgi:hypothetical protein